LIAYKLSNCVRKQDRFIFLTQIENIALKIPAGESRRKIKITLYLHSNVLKSEILEGILIVLKYTSFRIPNGIMMNERDCNKIKPPL